MQTLSDIIASIASFLWGWPLIILLPCFSALTSI